jgi:hypothetical protein
MITSNRRTFVMVVGAFVLSLAAFWSAGAHAAAAPVATITHLSGILTVKHPDGSVKILSVKSSVLEGDTLSTEGEAYARLKFIDNSEVVIRPNSVLKVTAFSFKEDDPKNDKVALDMVKGGLRAVSGLIGKRNKESVSFSTPTATIGIRGTHFGALFCQSDCGGVPTPSGATPPNGLHVDVAVGAVVLTNKGGTTQFSAGQFGYVANTNTPPVVVPPSQGIQVRMPTSISQNAPAAGATNKNSDPECVVQ